MNTGKTNVGGRFLSYGNQSPAIDVVPLLWAVGDKRYYFGNSSNIFGWICTVGGTPGTWVEIDFEPTALKLLTSINGLQQAIGNTGATKTITFIAGSLFALANVDQNTVITIDATGINTCNVRMQLRLTYGGVFTVAFLSASGVIKWVNATVPTPSSDAVKTDIYTFVWDGTNLYGEQGPNFA